jgi:hypothetical protein
VENENFWGLVDRKEKPAFKLLSFPKDDSK